jgi:hypothetical protein
MKSVVIELGDDEYEVEVEHFQAPGPYRWNEPPEPGELTLHDRVRCTDPHGGKIASISMEQFLKLYAEYHGIEQRAAQSMLDDVIFEHIMEGLED